MKELVNVKVDKDLKSNCDELFDSLGLDTETAINIFLTASLHHMGIPFHIGFDDCECDCDCDCVNDGESESVIKSITSGTLLG